MTVPSRPKALPRSAPRKSSWIRPETCGLSRPPPTPWTSRATTSSRAVGASPASRLPRVKTRDADDEHRAPAAHVAEAARGHEHQAEGQRVAGHDPLQLAGARRHGLADGGQGDVDDADVEQGHEPGHQADRQRLPAARVGGLVRRRCGHRRGAARGGAAHAATVRADLGQQRVGASPLGRVVDRRGHHELVGRGRAPTELDALVDRRGVADRREPRERRGHVPLRLGPRVARPPPPARAAGPGGPSAAAPSTARPRGRARRPAPPSRRRWPRPPGWRAARSGRRGARRAGTARGRCRSPRPGPRHRSARRRRTPCRTPRRPARRTGWTRGSRPAGAGRRSAGATIGAKGWSPGKPST